MLSVRWFELTAEPAGLFWRSTEISNLSDRRNAHILRLSIIPCQGKQDKRRGSYMDYGHQSSW